MIITFFNPAYLVETLEERGFRVDYKYTPKGPRLTVNYVTENRRVELAGFWHYMELIRTSLFTEDQVVSMLLQLVENLLSDEKLTYAKVPVRVHQTWGDMHMRTRISKTRRK